MISDGEYSVQDGCATCGSSEPAKRLSAVEAVGLLRKRQDFLRLSIEEMQQDIDSAGRLVAEIEGRRDRPAEAAPAPDPAQPPV